MNNDILQNISERVARIETKLDNHFDRVSKAESGVAETKRDIEWLRGHVKLATVIFLGVTGALGTLLLALLFPDK